MQCVVKRAQTFHARTTRRLVLVAQITDDEGDSIQDGNVKISHSFVEVWISSEDVGSWASICYRLHDLDHRLLNLFVILRIAPCSLCVTSVSDFQHS